MPNAHNAINSISSNTIGTQGGNQQMPTDIRAYHDRTLPSTPALRMVNPSQRHTVSDGRTQNYQVPFGNLAAQSPGILQVPTSNNLDMPNNTTEADLNTTSVEPNSQQEPSPPSYNAALDMVIVPCHN